MDNIQFNVYGIALNISLASTFGYNKVMVPFTKLEDLYNCQYWEERIIWEIRGYLININLKFAREIKFHDLAKNQLVQKYQTFK